MLFYKFRSHFFLLKNSSTFAAVIIPSHIGNKSGFKSQARGANRRIGGIAHCRNAIYILIRNFIRKFEANFALFMVQSAMHRRLFQPDKSIHRHIPYSHKIILYFSAHMLNYTKIAENKKRLFAQGRFLIHHLPYNSLSFALVFGPATPVCSMPYFFWNLITAALVSGP